MKLTFIILSWNSAAFLQRCLSSVQEKCAAESISYEVIVIDNGSSDTSVAMVSGFQTAQPERFRLISLPENMGTTYPRNLGLQQARGEFVCILDSDTEFGDGALAAVLKRLGTDPKIGMIVPRLLLPDGVVQNSVKRFPTLLAKLMKVPRILFGIKTANVDFYPDFPFVTERNVESAISACWFFRRDLLTTVGNLDERIFYAPEDVEYCLRVRQAGLAIIYVPTLTVLHHTQQITHKKPLSKTSLSHFFGLLYYFRKHGGWITRPTFD